MVDLIANFFNFMSASRYFQTCLFPHPLPDASMSFAFAILVGKICCRLADVGTILRQTNTELAFQSAVRMDYQMDPRPACPASTIHLPNFR